MKTTQANPTSHSAKAVDIKLEVMQLPVTDVDRSKRFYERLGWRLDADFAAGDWRLVQMTPRGSATSVMFGKGVTTATPGSVQGTFLIVDNLDAARQSLIAADVNVSEVFHFAGPVRISGGDGRLPGRDPVRDSYANFASFTDPDGNGFLIQEIKKRLPGRGFGSFDVAMLTTFLREAEKLHGTHEGKAGKHHWSEWYAPYIVARQRGRSEDEAIREATDTAGTKRPA